MDQPPLFTRLTAEFIGTFGFLFIAFSAVAVSVELPDAIAPAGVAAGFGLGLAFMIFAFGHISGGHFNPAVTLGLALGQQFRWRDLLPYWIAQIAGALAAAGLVVGVYGSTVESALVNAPGGGVSSGEAVALEIVVTALFLIVISAVATDSRAPWYGVFAPAAIGGFIFVALLTVGNFSGGAFNPARALAPSIVTGEGGVLWIYIVGTLIGGAIGGAIYWFIRQNPKGPDFGRGTRSSGPDSPY